MVPSSQKLSLGKKWFSFCRRRAGARKTNSLVTSPPDEPEWARAGRLQYAPRRVVEAFSETLYVALFAIFDSASHARDLEFD